MSYEKRFCIIISALLAIVVLISIPIALSTRSESEKINYNIAKQAQYFECERRVTVYNARTDNVIMYIEGYIDISNNATDELVVTAKVGENEYKKNYVYLNDYTLYVVEDIGGTHTDPYHYKVYFHTEILPDIEIKP